MIIISPAKQIKSIPVKKNTIENSQPIFIKETEIIANICKEKSISDLKNIMSISENLAQLNSLRYANWSFENNKTQGEPAINLFQGDVYQGLEASTLNQDDLIYAQQNLRILSGLYGLLKPLDTILPYRLEMGTKLENPAGKDLYSYWSEKITKEIIQTLQRNNQNQIINLASNEYSKVINKKTLKQHNITVITPIFKDYKNGEYKTISFYAKKARGTLTNYLIKNKSIHFETIKSFKGLSYTYIKNDGEENHQNKLIFTRR